MNDFPYYAFLEHLERIADALEHQNALLEPEKSNYHRPEQDGEQVRHLSLFLEKLPEHQYNCLRQKLLTTGQAARFLGISVAQLACLTKHKFIKGERGHYAMMDLLMWLDSDYNPDTEAPNAQ